MHGKGIGSPKGAEAMLRKLSEVVASTKPIQKHPDVIAWEEWLNSEEGKRCSAGSADGQYLHNRLWFAFMAGRGRAT
jgi:hypothetical protein